MDGPLVSLIMPVYNAFSSTRPRRKQFLPFALNALLRQSYRNFELIILDNRSSDDTAKMCREYSEKDKRIRFIVDSEKRYPEAAITKLGRLAEGKYLLIVNDDDLWEREYLEKLVSYMENYPDVDLAYGREASFDQQNMIIGVTTPARNEIYSAGMSRLSNFFRYVHKRNVIPIAFGLFKTEAFNKSLPYEDFDSLKNNIDNVFMSKFFLNGFKADYIKDVLFFYRRKPRKHYTGSYAPNMPSADKPVAVWLFYARHQMLFYKKIKERILDFPFTDEINRFLFSSILKNNIESSLGSLEPDELNLKDKNALKKLSWLKRSLAADLGSYRDIDSIMDSRGEYDPGDFGRWLLKMPETIERFGKLINFACSLEMNDESRLLSKQIKEIIKDESSGAMSDEQPAEPLIQEKAENKINFACIIGFIKKDVIKKIPFLFDVLLFLKKIYNTIRYFSIIKYAFKYEK